MKIDRRQLKADAREAMRGRKPSVYLVALVYLAVVIVLEALSAKLAYPGLTFEEIARVQGDPAAMASAMRSGSGVGSLLDIAVSVMNMMLGVGFTSFCLNTSRSIQAGFGDLFDGFVIFFRMLWLNILTGIFTMLWSLLFIVPGIIASYRYRLAVYILLDDPDKSALECIRESKELMQGRKGELFVLDLSFIGWSLLSVIPFVSVFTLPYIGITDANFYKTVSGQWDGAAPYEEPQQPRDPWDR